MTREAEEFASRVAEAVRPDPWVRRLTAIVGVAMVVALVVGLIGLYGSVRIAARANEQAARTIERLEASQVEASETIEDLEAEIGRLRDRVGELQDQVRALGGDPGVPVEPVEETSEARAAPGRPPDGPDVAETEDPAVAQGPSSSEPAVSRILVRAGPPDRAEAKGHDHGRGHRDGRRGPRGRAARLGHR